jgi:hypothetical protein
LYFRKESDNITLLLDILAEVDFYVRFNSIAFLTTLLQTATQKLQDAILTSPLGISRLIDLLNDHREIIRNEGLLLLIELTKSNADIQKIVAFENAFDRVFTIIFDEGLTDGGIIVQDCLNLVQNLLRYNASNQTFFRETGGIYQIPKLLSMKLGDNNALEKFDLSSPKSSWSDQKMANLAAVLSLIKILLGPNTPNTMANQVIFP